MRCNPYLQKKTKYPTNKILYKHFNEIWLIDLADGIAYKVLNNERYRYIFVIIDYFSK